MRLSPSGKTIFVLCREPRRVLALALDSWRVDWSVGLPADPRDMDVSADGAWIAVSHAAARTVSLIDVAQRRAAATWTLSGDAGVVRFHADHLIAGNLTDRMLAFFDIATRKLIVNLPLAVRPEHMCFKADGGEMFITGSGMDAVVVVEPYFTPQVAQTVLAGHNPGAMACTQRYAPGYLFVANPESGDVTILDLVTKNVVAVTTVGTGPSYIAITPDDQYALVLNEISGDMAVIRIPNVTRAVSQQGKWKKGPLFMLIPVGSKPVSAAIVSI
jgi:YVTN family beta-propeller protein